MRDISITPNNIAVIQNRCYMGMIHVFKNKVGHQILDSMKEGGYSGYALGKAVRMRLEGHITVIMNPEKLCVVDLFDYVILKLDFINSGGADLIGLLENNM